MPDEHDTPTEQTDAHRAAHEEVVPERTVDDASGPSGLSRRLDTGSGFLLGIILLAIVPVGLICAFALFEGVVMLIVTFIAAIAGTLGMLWLMSTLLNDDSQPGH